LAPLAAEKAVTPEALNRLAGGRRIQMFFLFVGLFVVALMTTIGSTLILARVLPASPLRIIGIVATVFFASVGTLVLLLFISYVVTGPHC
jgi:ABC-type amino acid transport system permease subunit